MINKALYSSKNGSWETPRNLFDELNREFNFTLDACATAKKYKVPDLLHRGAGRTFPTVDGTCLVQSSVWT